MRSIPAKSQVKLLPGLFRDRVARNRDYLLELDIRCLLQNYYLEAGEIMEGIQVVEDPSKARLHWGWESPTCQLRGHFLGHWLSAAAALTAREGDPELEVKIRYIVSELKRLQALNGNGWVAPIPEKYFDILMTDRYIWSPQYTMHKLLMGLTHVYLWMGIEDAKAVLDGLADWYLNWTDRAKAYAEQNHTDNAVYAGEQAGMLEVWAELLEATGEERYRTLVERYENNGLFDVLDRDGDPLTDNHANASIPLAHCAAKMYDVTGDAKWKERVLTFWKRAVTERGMFATTGANSGEFWIPMKKEAMYISRTDQEFCTVYNMVRLASWLEKETGERVYADYIERALYNGFLAQQSAQSGMPTYFLPLVAGSRKKWASKRNDFWCCLGTMVQAQTLYPELIYLTDEDADILFVEQFIPSEISCNLSHVQVSVRQTIGMKNYSNQAFFDERGGGALSRWSLEFAARGDGQTEWTLAIRVPEWCRGLPQVSVDGQKMDDAEVEKQIENGYLMLRRAFDHETVRIYFDSAPVFEALPDDPGLAAILSGPVVLAGLTEHDRPLRGTDAAEILSRRITHTYSTWPWEQDRYVTKGQEENIEFIPLYEVENEAYTVYFHINQ